MLLLGFRYSRDMHEMLRPQRGQHGHVGDGCTMETWPRLSPGVGPNLLLLDSVSSCRASAHPRELCADTSSHSYSSLCVSFHPGLSTSFHRPVSCHSSLPCSDVATLSPPTCARLQSCHPARPHQPSEGRPVGPCVLSQHRGLPTAPAPRAPHTPVSCLSPPFTHPRLPPDPGPDSLWVKT